VGDGVCAQHAQGCLLTGVNPLARAFPLAEPPPQNQVAQDEAEIHAEATRQ
jgi:hypothetical protein